MWLLTSILSAVFFAIASFIITLGTKRHYAISQMLFGLYISGALMFALYIYLFLYSSSIYNFNYVFNSQILLWGLIIGLGSALGNALFSYALKLGPVSLTAPLVNSNVILVIGMSVLYFGEIISLTQAIAISLLLFACFILPFDPDENKNVQNNQWYLVIVGTIFFMFLLNGGLKITKELGLNNSLVLLYSYLFAIVFFIVSIKYLAINNPNNPNNSSEYRMTTNAIIWQRKALLIGLFAGLFSFMGLQCYAIALENGPASIVVPIFSSRNVVVAMLCLWYFKEALSKIQKVALGTLLSGLVLVSF